MWASADGPGAPSSGCSRLFNLIVFVVLAILAAVTRSYIFWILYSLYAVAVIVPSLAVSWRRMQDTGRNGWWILLGLIPFVGGVAGISSSRAWPGSPSAGWAGRS